MTEERSNVFNTAMTALSSGVRALQDPFTYKAAGASLVPIVAMLALGYLLLESSTSSLTGGEPLDALVDLASTAAGWLIAFLIVVVASELWFYLAVGIRTVTREDGVELSTGTLLSAAAGRIFPVVGAFLLLVLAGAGLFVLTLVLKQLAGVAVLSIVVALLTLPLLGAWLLLTVSFFIGGAYMPGVAASRLEVGPGRILMRSMGIALAYPAPALLMLIFAGVTYFITFMILYFGFLAGIQVGIVPLLDEMLVNDQSFSAILTGIQVVAVGLVVFVVPYGIVAAAVTKFDRLIGDDPAIEAAPRTLLGMGWLGVRRAATSAGSAAGRIREKLDETAQQVASPGEVGEATAVAAEAGEPVPGEDSKYDQPPSEPQAASDPGPDDESKADPTPAESSAREVSAEGEPKAVTPVDEQDVKYCTSCGTDNPPEFRFCRSCGIPARD